MTNKVYLYGLIPTSEYEQIALPEKAGFDEQNQLYALPMNEITAIISKIDGDVYTEAYIEEKINQDLGWLQEKAFHHHEVLMLLNKLYTVIPLSFCTIYNDEDRLIQSITAQVNELKDSFLRISGKEEWNLKVYSDDEKLKKQVSENNPAIEEKRKEIDHLSRGQQFFAKKKLEQLLEKQLEKEREQHCMQIHDELTALSTYADVKKNWGKDATGRKDSMSWNSVYLLTKNEVVGFLEKVKVLEQEIGAYGLQIEATGPWPAYHFSGLGRVKK